MKISAAKMKSRNRDSFVVAARRIQSLHVFLFTLAVFGAVCLANAPLRADPINPFYDVTGTMTITGNNVCTPSPCRETIDFSFLYGYNYNSAFGVYDAYVVPSSISVSSFGALGSSFGYSGQMWEPTTGLRQSRCHWGSLRTPITCRFSREGPKSTWMHAETCKPPRLPLHFL